MSAELDAIHAEVAELRRKLLELEFRRDIESGDTAARLATLSRGHNLINGPFKDVFVAAVTGEDFAEKTVEGGNVVAFQDGRTGTVVRLTGKNRVLLEIEGSTSEYVEVGGTLFPVTVSQTGGVAGNKTTQCTFTYTVTDLDGNQLGTAIAPAMQRPALGAMTAATKGIAYMNEGAVVLQWCDEVPTRVAGCAS